MIGQTLKAIGIFETDEGSFVYMEEQDISAQSGGLPTSGLLTHRLELGPFDAGTAQETYLRLCGQYPLNMPTPALTGLEISG